MVKQTLLTVKEFRNETEYYFSLIIEKPAGYSFNAGDCVDLSFPDDLSGERKTFSFASSPSEKYIIITAKKGFSDYKHRLEKSKKGDILLSTQFGSYFTLQKDYESIFIAGGVGVAPFRSMIKDAIDKKYTKPMLLIYLSHSSNFPFIDEFKIWEKTHPFLTINTIATDKEGRITKEKIEELLPDKKRSQMCYVVGSPGLVDTMDDYLQSLGFSEDNIRTDSFDGYIKEA